MRYVIDRMSLADIPRVVEIEKLAYPSTWPPSAYRKELQENRYAHYIVARDTWATAEPPQDQRPIAQRRFPLSLLPSRPPAVPPPDGHGAIIGFAGLWLMVNEAHITTIANHPDYRGRGVGELLLVTLIGIAYEVGAGRVTLEVRVSNDVAQGLYRKYSFAIEGRRRRYYSDNHEDAYVMGTPFITTSSFREQFIHLRDTLFARLEAESGGPDVAGQPATASGDLPSRRGE